MTTDPSSDVLERLERKIASNGAWMTSDLREFYIELHATIERLSAERMQLREALTNPAAAASLRTLRAHYDKARCDNEAVACCIRCNVMFLVNSAESALRRMGDGY